MPNKVWYAPNKFESYGEEEIKAVEDAEKSLQNGEVIIQNETKQEKAEEVEQLF